MSFCGFFIKKFHPTPELNASVFNKKLRFGNYVGIIESSILFIHQKMSIFPTCESWKTAGKLLENSPSSFAIFLIIRNSSRSNSWHNCFMEYIFFCQRYDNWLRIIYKAKVFNRSSWDKYWFIWINQKH